MGKVAKWCKIIFLVYSSKIAQIAQIESVQSAQSLISVHKNLIIRSLGWNPLLTARIPETHWVQRLDSYFVEYALSESIDFMMTRTEIDQDLISLENRLHIYEQKYAMTSVDFYRRYQQGLLDDDGFEPSTEFVRWASAYELRTKRKFLQESIYP